MILQVMHQFLCGTRLDRVARRAAHCVPLKQRDDEPVDHQKDFEDDDYVTTSETHQTTHRWAAGKHSAVSRARGACALPQTVDEPEPDPK